MTLTIYVVYGANCKFDVLFGIWSEYSNADNKTLSEAIEQINRLYKNGSKSEKIVYETTVSELSANGS